MKDYLISLFLDDELTIDEKQSFVCAVASDERFFEEANTLLEQEKDLRARLVTHQPSAPVIPFRIRLIYTVSQLRPAFAGLAVAILLLAVVFKMQLTPVQNTPVVAEVPYRFVLYLPEVRETAVVGSFSDWQPVSMQKIGTSGYWTLDMVLEPGEYRYSYLVENANRMIDPTIQVRESDDFGGENSIITVGGTSI